MIGVYLLVIAHPILRVVQIINLISSTEKISFQTSIIQIKKIYNVSLFNSLTHAATYSLYNYFNNIKVLNNSERDTSFPHFFPILLR